VDSLLFVGVSITDYLYLLLRKSRLQQANQVHPRFLNNLPSTTKIADIAYSGQSLCFMDVCSFVLLVFLKKAVFQQ